LLRFEERQTRPPNLFHFLPRSFILPKDWAIFEQYRSPEKKYIVKSDQGSLGLGISIVKPGDPFPQPRSLCIAQEYIESKLIENKKFDLRVYVLVAAVEPLTIYVYRDGIARFCSEVNGTDTLFSQITNTAVNRRNPSVKITDITRPISAVFAGLEQEQISIHGIWGRIDDAIVQTILSVSDFLKKGVAEQLSSGPYSRCFQILGFDILLDQDLDPHLLEVNYRPSLGFDFPVERAMKEKMLAAAIKIVAPYALLQRLLPVADWREKFSQLLLPIQKARDDAVRNSLFDLVFRENASFMRPPRWANEILRRVNDQKHDLDRRYGIPIDLCQPPAPPPGKLPTLPNGGSAPAIPPSEPPVPFAAPGVRSSASSALEKVPGSINGPAFAHATASKPPTSIQYIPLKDPAERLKPVKIAPPAPEKQPPGLPKVQTGASAEKLSASMGGPMNPFPGASLPGQPFSRSGTPRSGLFNKDHSGADTPRLAATQKGPFGAMPLPQLGKPPPGGRASPHPHPTQANSGLPVLRQ
jgi:hypothetical protein